jgi:RNA polymerase sigma factor (sigma-70 family)
MNHNLEFYQTDPQVKRIFYHINKSFKDVKAELQDYENYSLFKAFSTYNPVVSNFYTYLTIVHRNRALSLRKVHERRKKERNNIYDVEPSYISDISRSDKVEEVSKMMKKLSSEEAFVVQSRIWEDKTFEEIGKDLDITLEAVRKKYNKALEKMKYVM